MTSKHAKRRRAKIARRKRAKIQKWIDCGPADVSVSAMAPENFTLQELEDLPWEILGGLEKPRPLPKGVHIVERPIKITSTGRISDES